MSDDWRQNLIDNDEEIRRILQESRRIAVIGIKDESRASEPAHAVPRYLREHGYRIYGVNPNYPSVFGQPTVARLTDIGEEIDIVEVFRAPQNIPPHAEEALQKRPKVFWMQSGIRHAEAAEKLARAGIKVVQDRCMYVEHRRLIGDRRP